MEDNTMDGKEKICPFLEIPCQQLCPAWLEDAEDCTFHVCMTQVRSTFYEAAEFLDKQIGLEQGKGYEMLRDLRETLSGVLKETGSATKKDKGIAQGFLNGLLAAGVVDKISTYTLSDLGALLSGAEKVIRFGLNTLFPDDSEDEYEEADEEDPLIFTE